MIAVAACGGASVSVESHEELRSEVRGLKSEIRDLTRSTERLEQDAERTAPAGEHEASAVAAPGHGAGGPAHWAYTGSEGPATWGDLSPDFVACSTGVNQSPINITAATGVEREQVSLNYAVSGLTVVNNGHTVQANVESGSTMLLDGAPYQLAQFHFHTPSEHTLNGEYFALEMHLVHVGESGALAVVGVVFDEGVSNEILAPVWAVLPHDTATEAHVSDFDLKTLVPAGTSFYRYSGSLTTPPCSEGVRWMVAQDSSSVSAGQVDEFGTLVGPNNRPVQPLNAREVLAEGSFGAAVAASNQ